MLSEKDEDLATVAAEVALRHSQPPSPKQWMEGMLALTVLGELDAFPDAPLGAILEVRESLSGPRSHFRAAMSAAAERLVGTQEPVNVEHLASALRLDEIEPALDEIRVTLDSLSMRRMLKRVSADRPTVAAAASSISVVAGASAGLPDLAGILASGVLSGAALSALAREANFREEVRAGLRVRPYWFLHEANRRLASSG